MVWYIVMVMFKNGMPVYMPNDIPFNTYEECREIANMKPTNTFTYQCYEKDVLIALLGNKQ